MGFPSPTCHPQGRVLHGTLAAGGHVLPGADGRAQGQGRKCHLSSQANAWVTAPPALIPSSITLTLTAALVCSQFIARVTGTLVAAQRVHAALLTPAVVRTRAFVRLWGGRKADQSRRLWWGPGAGLLGTRSTGQQAGSITLGSHMGGSQVGLGDHFPKE